MVPTAKLNSGYDIPLIGFGTATGPTNETYNAILHALKTGYRHLDFAKVYGNQKEIGRALRDSGVPRSELFIVSKLWDNAHRPELVEKALDDTLAELGLDYLDLYLIHFPVAFQPVGDISTDLFPLDAQGKTLLDLDTSLVDTWRSFSQLPKSGKARSVGVSNFLPEYIETVANSVSPPFYPAVNQVERHAYLPQRDLLDYAKEKGVHITGYSPLGNDAYQSLGFANPKRDSITPLLKHPVVNDIAAKHGVSTGQVLISWSLQTGSSVIPKSVTPSRIEQNFNTVTLSDDDLAKLADLSKDGEIRFNIPFCYPGSTACDVDIFGTDEEQVANHKVKVQ